MFDGLWEIVENIVINKLVSSTKLAEIFLVYYVSSSLHNFFSVRTHNIYLMVFGIQVCKYILIDKQKWSQVSLEW